MFKFGLGIQSFWGQNLQKNMYFRDAWACVTLSPFKISWGILPCCLQSAISFTSLVHFWPIILGNLRWRKFFHIRYLNSHFMGNLSCGCLCGNFLNQDWSCPGCDWQSVVICIPYYEWIIHNYVPLLSANSWRWWHPFRAVKKAQPNPTKGFFNTQTAVIIVGSWAVLQIQYYKPAGLDCSKEILSLTWHYLLQSIDWMPR
jgi:hypothetical protein